MVVTETNLSQLVNMRLIELMMEVVAVVILTGSFIQGFSAVAASLTSMLETSSSMNPSTSETQIAFQYDEVDGGGKSVKKLSKSRRIVKKSPKNLKGLNSCKGHQFGGMFTKALVLRQQTIQVFVRTLTVFQALFAGPRSYFNTTLALIIDKAKLMELLMRYHVLPQRS